MFDLSRKVIFTHPPKCAGTTIEGLFGWHPSTITDEKQRNDYVKYFRKWKHGSLDAHLNELHLLGEDLSNYFILSCIRNPWDRAVSFYYHLKIKAPIEFKTNNPGAELPEYLAAAQNYPFEEFLYRDYERVQKGGFNNLHVAPFIKSNLNRIPNLIIRYENYLADLQIVAEKYGLDTTNMHSFNTDSRPKGTHYKNYYTTNLSVSLVAELAKDSIDTFGYTF